MTLNIEEFESAVAVSVISEYFYGCKLVEQPTVEIEFRSFIAPNLGLSVKRIIFFKSE